MNYRHWRTSDVSVRTAASGVGSDPKINISLSIERRGKTPSRIRQRRFDVGTAPDKTRGEADVHARYIYLYAAD